jgi:carboxylesterase
MSAFSIGWWVALILAALVFLLPVRTRSLGAHPHPVPSFNEAIALIERQRTADSAIVAPGGEPILLVHGNKTPRVVVLLHGFTNAPRQFLLLAQALYEQGDNVYVPRMPYHAERGNNITALARITAEKLRDCSDQVVDVATGLGDSVIVVGLSMGGTMAAWIAVFRPEVRRVVIIAPLIALSHVPGVLQSPAMNLAVRFPNVNVAGAPDSTRPDRDLGVSTRAIGEILRLGAAVRRAPERDAPRAAVALLLNAHDRTIANGPVRDLVDRWKSAGSSVIVVELPDSLQLPHDVIDAMNPFGKTCVVYPIVESLISGFTPATVNAETSRAPARRLCP